MHSEYNKEPRLVGWQAISDHLNKTGRKCSIYWLQRYGRRSIGGFDAGLIGYHGPHPVSIPSMAERAWDAIVKPVADMRQQQIARQESMEGCAK
jgi:hypothetical protein